MNSKGNMPKQQPKMMPKMREPKTKVCTDRNCCCCNVSLGCGRPKLSAERSINPWSVIPAASETIWPMPAAAKELRQNATPIVFSMAPPTVSMIMLSKNPNPMKGTALLTCKCHNCWAVGFGTAPSAIFIRVSASAPKRALAHSMAVAPSTAKAIRRQADGSEFRSATRQASVCVDAAGVGSPELAVLISRGATGTASALAWAAPERCREGTHFVWVSVSVPNGNCARCWEVSVADMQPRICCLVPADDVAMVLC
mmetsp:Transcript_68987/g.173762  ORF Transcript_68987/g.173762 Transcript_68987/m.173762 type:complete len:255 (+) Transcript_68987:1130-1894(+)